ncbi:HAMP domain-containing histidine kinase [Methanocalculus taiwanensis]|uniref:Signal transduction histidine-protein kinase/phosphatase MprB n=1 Tax=Methanocalculus taiwanensis TaxID=106207 RepID=A0ABD4TGX3_9EURY|nr:HAMP domain-containing histidine kinase [Methanocalculus taiwanensis]
MRGNNNLYSGSCPGIDTDLFGGYLVTRSSLTEEIPFSWLLFGSIVLIILIITAVVINVNYHSSRVQLENTMLLQQEKNEEGLIQSMILVDRGLLLFDQSLDYKLKDPMDLFLQEYEKSEGDPAKIDLEGLKASFGKGYELYIINEAGVIEYTTYPPDHLMDFSEYPQFYRRLTQIREGNVFTSDRITKDFSTGMFRKFVYHPTPDHCYILEISYMDDQIQEMRSALRYTEAAGRIHQLNPYLTSIRIFNFIGDEVGNSSYTPEEWRSEIISTVTGTKETVEIGDYRSDIYTRFLLIDLSSNENPPEMNLVAEMTYNTAPIKQQLHNLLMLHLLIAVIAILIGGILAYAVAETITRPIHRLVNDTKIISGGDLNHPIKIAGPPELRSLSLSIQQMMDRLKDMMSRLQASEEELKVQNEELEERVLERTADLTEAHARVGFFLDLITHDINNTNHTSMLYLELLESEAAPSLAPYIEPLRASLKKSDEIIDNVATLREIQDAEASLMPVEIAPILRKEAKADDRIDLHMEDEEISVFADSLLTQAISNIISNSLKFGGDDVRVTISVSTEDDHVRITINDTGPGIPDAMKPVIFTKYTRGTERVKGKGLGLFIVHTLIVDRYGGSVSVEDRVPGDPSEGVSFIIRLKKAPAGQ